MHLLTHVRKLTDADKAEGSPFYGTGIYDWAAELSSGERGMMSDKALKFLSVSVAVKQIKAARTQRRVKVEANMKGGEGSDDGGDDVEPYEDGSLCSIPPSGKTRTTRRRVIVRVHTRKPLKYVTDSLGAVRYFTHAQLTLISTPAQLREEEERAREEAAERERAAERKRAEAAQREHEARDAAALNSPPLPPPQPRLKQSQGLPPGWKAAQDASGQVYYYNKHLGRSTYELPTLDSPPMPPPSLPQSYGQMQIGQPQCSRAAQVDQEFDDEQIIRLRGMLVYASGDKKAELQGELAVLERRKRMRMQ